MTSPGLLRIHRWVALGAGGLVLLLTLSGASLVFRDELTEFFTPAIAIAPRPAAPDAWQRVLGAVRAHAPDARSIEIEPSGRPERAWEAILEGSRAGRSLFVDPHDGRVVADSAREAMPFLVLFRLHTSLLLGPAGEYAVAAFGGALAFLAASGLWLWRPRAWKHALRIRLGGNRVAKSYDLHRTAGAAFALFLLVNALTGITLALDEATPRAVNALARSEAPPYPRASSGALRPLDELVAAANAAFPEGRVARVRVHRAEGEPVMVRKRLPADNETNGMNRIFVDGATGVVLAVRPVARQAPGNAMYEWIYPLHTGKLAGWPHRILLVVAGLVPILSLATGIILWRSKSKRKKNARTPAPDRQLA